jgi:hypothetical protein
MRDVRAADAVVFVLAVSRLLWQPASATRSRAAYAFRVPVPFPKWDTEGGVGHGAGRQLLPNVRGARHAGCAGLAVRPLH